MTPIEKLMEIAQIKGIGKTAELLGYSYAYVHQVLYSTIVPGELFLNSVNSLYRILSQPKKKRRPRNVITFNDRELAAYFDALTMQERRQMVREYYQKQQV